MTQSLGELTTGARRVALVGLAKNTGKTVALNALLAELRAQGRRVGVTSVGRDGEERDAIDFRIAKPRIELAGESLVATTDLLMRTSGLPHETLERTGMRTPLGEVLIARLRGPGIVEVAGPSAAADVRAVADAMLAYGAEQILIDGAIDRRAASSPDVSDGLVMSTGAVLDRHIEEVVRRTAEAVELVRLPVADDEGEPLELAPRFALTAEGEQLAALLDAHPDARRLRVAGALPDRFLELLLNAAHRRRREFAVVVADPTKIFLSKRGPSWFRAQGIDIQTLRAIELKAITVNPVAPQSHQLDSARLRALLAETIRDVPILDVLHADYAASTALSGSRAP
ncbi:MAG TPA: hypothetical protein VN892_18245 [Solirubrobacteraceae bacterium]|nr:hypothetical protein [Solirubrobacteraceae bacterium]